MSNIFEESPGVYSAMRVMSLLCVAVAAVVSLVLMLLLYVDKADSGIVVAVGAGVISPLLAAGITGKALQKGTESNEAVRMMTVEAEKDVKVRAIEGKEEIATIENEN